MPDPPIGSPTVLQPQPFACPGPPEPPPSPEEPAPLDPPTPAPELVAPALAVELVVAPELVVELPPVLLVLLDPHRLSVQTSPAPQVAQ